MAEQNEDMLSKLGIDIESGKIHIDINKTKDFFNMLQNTLQSKADDLDKNISEGKVDVAESAGIKIDKEHIDIDLNKTKDFIKDLGSKLESFTGEIDKAVERIGMDDAGSKNEAGDEK